MKKIQRITPDRDFAHNSLDHISQNLIISKEQIAKLKLRILNSDKKKQIKLSDENKNKVKWYLNTIKKIQNNEALLQQEYFLNAQEVLQALNISDKDFLRFLFYRYDFNIYPRLKNLSKYPPCVQIEPTSICNYRCVMCYQIDKSFSGKSHGMMGHMSLDLFKKIIDELEGNVEAITLASRGEPTLNPNIVEMLEYCRNKFLGLKINTNASMLNEKLIHSILSSNFSEIVFSVDAADKDAYEKIRINGKFDKVVKNLTLFSEIKKKFYKDIQTIVKISGVKINNEINVSSLEERFREFADIIQLVGYTPWESAYDNDKNSVLDPCGFLWRRMFVWWDGKVNPCDYDYKSKLSVWNVKEKNISDIWNSKEYNNYRNLHLNKQRKEIYPCDRCSFTSE